MGNGAKKQRAEQRKTRKRAAKAARRALYASYAGTGRRSKKTGQSGGPTAQRGNHATTNCGNVGCNKCFSQFRCLPQNSVLRRSVAR